MYEESKNFEASKTESNFPNSLQSSWKNEFVVRIKRKRKKRSISHTPSMESGIIMRNINPLKNRYAAEDNKTRISQPSSITQRRASPYN